MDFCKTNELGMVIISPLVVLMWIKKYVNSVICPSNGYSLSNILILSPNFSGWLKNNIMLEVILESRDHWAKNAMPRAVNIVLANTAISFCCRPQTPASNIMTVMVVNRWTALTMIFLLALWSCVFFNALFIMVFVTKKATK